MRYLRWLKHIPLTALIGLIGIWISSVFFSINCQSVYGLIGIGNGGMIVWFFDNSELRAVLPSLHVSPTSPGWRVPHGSNAGARKPSPNHRYRDGAMLHPTYAAEPIWLPA